MRGGGVLEHRRIPRVGLSLFRGERTAVDEGGEALGAVNQRVRETARNEGSEGWRIGWTRGRSRRQGAG
jgi:hypothetical protein